MSRVRVHAFAVSLDGYGAGPGQSAEAPLGAGGERLHEWIFATATGRAMVGRTGGATGIDDDAVGAGVTGIGATVMGRNMFGPVRGPWPDGAWRGWWGETPPFHHPVFVLTHHPRPAIEMAGGTTFHFVTDGLADAVERARVAAAPDDVRVGGGVATVREALTAGLVDDAHLAVVPVLLGGGEPLLPALPGLLERYDVAAFVPTAAVAHVHLRRR